MKPRNKVYKIAGVIALASLLSACGSQAYRETADFGQSQNDGGGGGGTTPIPTPTPSSSPGVSAVTETFSITGNCSSTSNCPTSASWTSSAVYTDNVLKIRVKPDMAPVIATYSGYTPTSNCISYNITVLGKTVRTAILKVGANSTNCPNAPTEQTLDFSDRLSPGHNEVNISVSAVQTDWKYSQCLNGGAQPYNIWLWPNVNVQTCSFYGTMNNLYKTHSGTGSLDIQVNGTSL